MLTSKSIVQYVEPFLSVKIDAMAKAFGTEESAMLHQVESLIYAGKIKGKIDLIDRVSRASETKFPSLDAPSEGHIIRGRFG